MGHDIMELIVNGAATCIHIKKLINFLRGFIYVTSGHTLWR